MAEQAPLNFDDLWTPTEKNKIIRASNARNRLRVGGTGSSKSSDSMMEVVKTLLMWKGMYGLILRRTMQDLKKSNIPDFQRYVPKELYTWNQQDSTATFYNGSKLFFSHCQNSSEKDLQAYQSASFPIIFIDEAGYFPGSVWLWLQSRNRVNPQCEPNAEGKFPSPCMLGACNPIGPHWSWYKAQFVDKKPLELPKGARRDKNGRYWVPNGIGGWMKHPVYDPFQWDYIHSTVLDNPHMLKKDPEIVSRLSQYPEHLRKKLLDGDLESTGGQFYDCFDANTDVVNLRQAPDAIIWEPWQPRWIGWDWGRSHYSAVYWFTLAQVLEGDRYKRKVVCYREYVDKGKDYVDLSSEVIRLTKRGLPTGNAQIQGGDVTRIYFSHEAFSKNFEDKAPAEKIGKYLLDEGLPMPIKSTKDRVGRAQLLYNMLNRRELVILDNCPDIIRAIPQLVPDERDIEDVLKTDKSAADRNMDTYDAFTYGLFGEMQAASIPQEELDRRRIANSKDDLQRILAQIRMTKQREKQQQQAELRTPDWMSSPVLRDREW